jgi:superfamily II DNA/RNA helicase
MGIARPTEAQSVSIPAILEGRDLIVSAATGEGKTLSFLLPIVHRLKEDETARGIATRPGRPRAIVLAPTRELALQIYGVAKRLCHHAKFRAVSVVGGGKQGTQRRTLDSPVDMVIATPGRLALMLKEEALFLSDVRYVAVDEADTIVADAAGFGDELERVLAPLRAWMMPFWKEALGRLEAERAEASRAEGERRQRERAEAQAQPKRNRRGEADRTALGGGSSGATHDLDLGEYGMLDEASTGGGGGSAVEPAEPRPQLRVPEGKRSVQFVLVGATMPKQARSRIQELLPLAESASARTTHRLARTITQRFVRVSAVPSAKHSALLAVVKQVSGPPQAGFQAGAHAAALDVEGEENEDEDGDGVAEGEDLWETVAAREAGEALAVDAEAAKRGRPVLVFCNTLASARSTAYFLQEHGYDAASLHGGIPPILRAAEFARFLAGDSSILVCTDAAARGLHFPALETVVMFDFPLNPVDYLHRSGRVGRAGKRGTVVSLVAKRDVVLARAIQRATDEGKAIATLSSDRKDYEYLQQSQPAAGYQRGGGDRRAGGRGFGGSEGRNSRARGMVARGVDTHRRGSASSVSSRPRRDDDRRRGLDRRGSDNRVPDRRAAPGRGDERDWASRGGDRRAGARGDGPRWDGRGDGERERRSATGDRRPRERAEGDRAAPAGKVSARNERRRSERESRDDDGGRGKKSSKRRGKVSFASGDVAESMDF